VALRALHGLLKPHMYGGRHVAMARKFDGPALSRQLAQLERTAGAGREKSQDFDGRSASTGDGQQEWIVARSSPCRGR
jgi:hypothetical protein